MMTALWDRKKRLDFEHPYPDGRVYRNKFWTHLYQRLSVWLTSTKCGMV